MRKALSTLLLLAAAFCGMHTGALAAGNEINQELTNWMQRVCHYEDSTNCYWDAGTSGNHRGHSFFAHTINGVTCLMYVDQSYAQRHDRCLDQQANRAAFIDLDHDGGGAETR